MGRLCLVVLASLAPLVCEAGRQPAADARAQVMPWLPALAGRTLRSLPDPWAFAGILLLHVAVMRGEESELGWTLEASHSQLCLGKHPSARV